MNISKKIVLIEDNPAEAELVMISIQRDYPELEVCHFSNGKEFEAYAEECNCADCSLILMDLNMPSMNGSEVLAKIRKKREWQFIPVVIFSSSKNIEDIRNCYKAGANAFVTKPFDLDVFETTLNAILKFWVYENVFPKEDMISMVY